jgi:guanylate kinase
MKKTGSLIVISGPSGVGKSTLIGKVRANMPELEFSISCTTRAPRTGEVHGREYYFLSKDEFLRKMEDGEFLEYDEHFGNFYGTLASFVKEQLEEKSVVLEIDVVGGLNAKKAFPESVLVMIAPPSVEVLKQRLVSRNSESAEEIENRLSRLEFELSKKDEYDYVVVNDDLERAIEEVNALIDKAKKQK